MFEGVSHFSRSAPFTEAVCGIWFAHLACLNKATSYDSVPGHFIYNTIYARSIFASKPLLTALFDVRIFRPATTSLFFLCSYLLFFFTHFPRRLRSNAHCYTIHYFTWLKRLYTHRFPNLFPVIGASVMLGCCGMASGCFDRWTTKMATCKCLREFLVYV